MANFFTIQNVGCTKNVGRLRISEILFTYVLPGKHKLIFRYNLCFSGIQQYDHLKLIWNFDIYKRYVSEYSRWKVIIF